MGWRHDVSFHLKGIICLIPEEINRGD